MNRAERRNNKKNVQGPAWKRPGEIPQRPLQPTAGRGGKSLVRRVSQEKGRGS